MTPRSIAIARTSGEPAPSTNIPPAVPNPALPAVRAHNWVVLGALLDNPGQPPWCLPLSGRLYFRKSQLPLQAQDSDHTVVFRTKCELVVELIREQARDHRRAAPWGL